jgi:DNA-binding NarL/FixJ family response regulator
VDRAKADSTIAVVVNPDSPDTEAIGRRRVLARLEVTRRLRNEPDPALRDVPVVLITAQSGPENTAAGFAGGVTDYLTKPFRPAHVRARVQAWLLRRPAPHKKGNSQSPPAKGKSISLRCCRDPLRAPSFFNEGRSGRSSTWENHHV